MNKNTLAKIEGWIGAALTAMGTSNALGKWSIVATLVGGALTGHGIHNASDTSAVSPNAK